MRGMIHNPANPQPYIMLSVPKFAAFPPSALCRILARAQVLEPGREDMAYQADQAHQLDLGRSARRAAFSAPADSIREVAFEWRTLKFVVDDQVSASFFDRVMPEGHVHEPGLVEFLHRRLRVDDVVIDVGAHVGYLSCVCASLGATVIALELQRSLLPVIATNAALNDLWSIHPICASAGEAAGLSQIYRSYPRPGTMDHSVRSVTNNFPLQSVNHDLVPRLRLDDLADPAKEPIRWVKIDVEGAEARVLAGARSLIAARQTRFLVEVHPHLLATFDDTLGSVLDPFGEGNWRLGIVEDTGDISAISRQDFVDPEGPLTKVHGNPMVLFEPL